MSRVLPSIVAFVVATILQVGLAPHMAIGGVVPNFLLLVVITIALVSGRTAGTVAGFAAGLILDFIGTAAIGPSILVLTVVGYIAGSLQENMFAEGWLMPVSVVFGATLTAEIAYALLLSLLGEGSPLLGAFTSVILPSAVYNGVLALLLYPWLARFLRREKQMTTFGRIG